MFNWQTKAFIALVFIGGFLLGLLMCLNFPAAHAQLLISDRKACQMEANVAPVKNPGTVMEERAVALKECLARRTAQRYIEAQEICDKVQPLGIRPDVAHAACLKALGFEQKK